MKARRLTIALTLLALAIAPLACGGAVEGTDDPSCPTVAASPAPSTTNATNAPAPTTHVSVGGTTPAAPPAATTAATCNATTTNATISATTPWTDTGLDVEPGSILTIAASGTPTYGDDPAQVVDADGGDYTGVVAWDDDVVPPPVPTEALIGKVGGTTDLDTGVLVPAGAPQDGPGFVGTSYQQTMTTGGRLFLGYNDQRPAFGDNSGAFSVSIAITCPTPPHIAFFGAAGSFDEDSLMSFLQSYPATVTRDEANAAPVTAETLAADNIVVLDALERSFDGDEAAALASWVQGGGEVLSLTGFVNDDPTTWQRPNSLMADLPIQYTSEYVVGDGGNACPETVTTLSPSPVTAGLTSVPFCGGYGVTGGTVVAKIGAAPVGAIAEVGSGRVYVWGDEWVEYSSTWGAGTQTQQFWQDGLDWLNRRS